MKNKFLSLSPAMKVVALVVPTLALVGGVGIVNGENAPTPAAQTVSAPQQTVETKEITETVSLPFSSETKDDASMASGTSKVVQEGVNGEKTITYQVVYEDGVEKSKVAKSEVVTKQPVSKITANGTYVAPPPKPASNCDPNYSPCIPNVSYDLDCGDIGFTVNVVGSDVHRLDRDRDGYGCE